MRFALSALFVFVGTISAQPTKPREVPPGQFEARFADGSSVTLELLDKELTVATKYGKLAIPLADVRRLELGFRYAEGVEAKIQALAGDLGSTDFRTREKAEAGLLAYKEVAVPTLRKAVKGEVVEGAKRAEELLKKLEASLPKEKLEFRDHDLIKTATMTIRGTLQTDSLKTKTKYFGDTTVKFADLRDLRPMGAAANEGIALDAGKYAKQQWTAWLDTGLDVEGQQSLEIAATGKIDQWLQTPGQYMSSPAGNGANVMGPPQWANQRMAWVAGAVYARVGDQGMPFLVGSNFKQAKVGAGRLYLIIAPSNWNNESSGEYQVTVKIGE